MYAIGLYTFHILPQVSQKRQQLHGLSSNLYLQSSYDNPNCKTQQASYPVAFYSPHQFQGITTPYCNDPDYQSSTYSVLQYPNYNQCGSPIKAYVSSSSKSISYKSSVSMCSPTHRLYGSYTTVPNEKENSNREIGVSMTLFINKF